MKESASARAERSFHIILVISLRLWVYLVIGRAWPLPSRWVPLERGSRKGKGQCMGCGVCEDVCAPDAIHMRREPSKGDPLDLAELKAQQS